MTREPKSKIRHKIKHYLIAHKENDYTPQILTRTSIAVLFVVIIASSALAFITPRFLASTNTAAVYASTLETLASQDRITSKLPPLNVSPLLEQAAEMKADDMAAKGYFAHYAPDGTSPWYWISKAGYKYSYAGENLAIDFSDSSDVNNAWLASPLHRANILNSHYTDIGVATAEGVYEGHPATYVVQMFGSPATTVSVQKTNNTLAAVIVSNPRHIVVYFYIALGILLLIAIISLMSTPMLNTGHSAHKFRHILYGLGLILLMYALIEFIIIYFGTGVM